MNIHDHVPMSIPAELQSVPRWVLYIAHHTDKRKESGLPKTSKVPYRVSGGKASTTDPRSWSTFDQAVARLERGGYSGIGFVFSADDRYVGIDLDGCVDPATGEIAPWALAVVKRFASYTEVSPGGDGLHIIVRGTLPPGGRKKGDVEVYDWGRFFTMTGNVLPGAPATVEERTDELAAWHAEAFPPPAVAASIARTPHAELTDDAELLARARHARNGEKFRRLYDLGDWAGEGYLSQSDADLALCGSLRFWTGADLGRMDALFRASALMRAKWDERRGTDTYGQMTLAKALLGDVYHPGDGYEGPTDDALPDLGTDDGSGISWATAQVMAEALRRERAARRSLEERLDLVVSTLQRKDLDTGERVALVGVTFNAWSAKARIRVHPGAPPDVPALNYGQFSDTWGISRPKIGDVLKIATTGEDAPFQVIRRPAFGLVGGRDRRVAFPVPHTRVSVLPQPEHQTIADTTAAMRRWSPCRDNTRKAKDKAAKRAARSAQVLAEASAVALAAQARCPHCAGEGVTAESAVTVRATARCDVHQVVFADAIARRGPEAGVERVDAPPVPDSVTADSALIGSTQYYDCRIGSHGGGGVTADSAATETRPWLGRRVHIHGNVSVWRLLEPCRSCGWLSPPDTQGRPCQVCVTAESAVTADLQLVLPVDEEMPRTDR